ncbi:MAG: aldehyde dehydrogenase family protein [Candidatus Nitrosotenuis sp.]|uniref:L-glutamate gamma-semialdehyde dehydrogenase n=1 Tax=Candidatus Nitrosotenuis uzonensis TaxID=1407055 RepID=A0A812F2C3_9ARCH|nr:aldehyde dehydrogenase family protein [Candidatus Nitrosotenuis uzonensis]MCA2003722.1 aldehyde dehydrogenase family protein [Candidatus Nitrosotenuis sp.]CAE6489787.1 1-pyrroline-5-carboxylate dehydrogenase [Candidatus Nitrosotenuis uzonensis]
MIENENTWLKAIQNNTTDEFHKKFDQALESLKNELGKTYPLIINGKEIEFDQTFEVRSPSDTSIILGKFPLATKEHTDQAILAAKEAFHSWSQTHYTERVKLFFQLADNFSAQKFRLAAIISMENGKNRLEAMGEIDETIDFLRFYADQLDTNQGFVKPTKSANPNEKTQSVLKPYGVWGIIPPFNFPSAIAIGMSSGALITANTVVLKPASDTPISAFQFVDAIYRKIPAGAINLVTGKGNIVGQAIIENPDVSGIAFTGSKEVGISGFRTFTRDMPKPFISEMGGKNPVIVTNSADLEKATDGVLRAAFGYGGQKCSACSRVYVEKNIANQFLEKLVSKTKQLKIGLPWEKDTYLGPVINENARKKYEKAVEEAKKDGKIVFGGSVLKDGQYQRGYYVQPTIVTDLPKNHHLIKEELFLPFLCVQEFENFDDAIKQANDSEYGLTAGIFSQDKKQIDEFFSKIEAGVTYANRAQSATTGAVVQAQPFVGWKSSGISGKGAGGAYYLTQFLREQTQTICNET